MLCVCPCSFSLPAQFHLSPLNVVCLSTQGRFSTYGTWFLVPTVPILHTTSGGLELVLRISKALRGPVIVRTLRF